MLLFTATRLYVKFTPQTEIYDPTVDSCVKSVFSILCDIVFAFGAFVFMAASGLLLRTAEDGVHLKHEFKLGILPWLLWVGVAGKLNNSMTTALQLLNNHNDYKEQFINCFQLIELIYLQCCSLVAWQPDYCDNHCLHNCMSLCC